MRFSSVRIALTCAIVGFMALLAVVSVSAFAGLKVVGGSLQTVDGKWLSGFELLGALSKAAIPSHAAEGEPAADEPEGLLDRYAALVDGSVTPDAIEAFRQAWASYRAQVQAGADPGVRAEGYAAVEAAEARLAAEARAAADAETAAGGRSAAHAITALTALTSLAGLLAAGLIALIDRHVSRPLDAITAALARLAEGHCDIRVPELHRSDEIGAIAKACEMFRTNTFALADAQQRAEALARHDALTGLPNRRLFASDLDAALGRCLVDGSVCCVMLLDLDGFKPVNDLHGHAAGDVVLCRIATRLREVVGAAGSVARLGGDEFAVILAPHDSRRSSVEAAIGLAGRIVASVAEPVEIEQARIDVGASIGISLCPSDGATAEDVLRTADMAMYRAKHAGRGTFRFFERTMDAELRTRVALEADVRAAVQRNAIEPHFQPLIDLSSDRIAGFEVLARWNHPDRGFVPPDTFIPIVEQLGLLDQLTGALLLQSFRAARSWDPHVRVAVNISPAQFQDLRFAPTLAMLLRTERFDPRRLEIEVTETALIGDLKAAHATLEALQCLGVRVVLDDFGTGYSSLSHLREFRFNKIKIDSSFIRSLMTSADSRAIVDAVLGLTHNLGLPTVAEGVESAEVRRLLASRGCEFGQGYLFSKAVPADVATAMLQQQGEPQRRAAG